MKPWGKPGSRGKWTALGVALADRSLPLEFWSRERLMSDEARHGWLEPDLRPLE